MGRHSKDNDDEDPPTADGQWGRTPPGVPPGRHSRDDDEDDEDRG